MNKEKEEADKELNTGKETPKTDANSLGDLDFAVAAVLTLPAIMSTAIPESTHISIKSRILLLSFASLPLVLNRIYSLRSYYSRQRAQVAWVCIILVLIVAHLVDKSNDNSGVYNCYHGTYTYYSDCWEGKSHCDFFFMFIGLPLLFGSSAVFFVLLATLLIESNPRQRTVIVTTIASVLTIWLVLPISLVPSSLFRTLRPLQTFLSTSLISFGLSLYSVGKWFKIILSVCSLLLALLNTWSFAQFDGTFLFICGLSGTFCYMIVIIGIIGNELDSPPQDSTAKSQEHV